MDISFDIHNDKGDQVRVALSYYRTRQLSTLTSASSSDARLKSTLLARQISVFIQAVAAAL